MTEIQTIQSDGTTPQGTKADQITGQISPDDFEKNNFSVKN